jgi:hypothetical protein
MVNYWLHGIYFLTVISFHQYAEGRHSAHKKFHQRVKEKHLARKSTHENKPSTSRAIGTEENTKEVRHIFNALRKRKTDKRFRIAQKGFNMDTINYPFIRRGRSSKIGIVPLYKLSNKNK